MENKTFFENLTDEQVLHEARDLSKLTIAEIEVISEYYSPEAWERIIHTAHKLRQGGTV